MSAQESLTDLPTRFPLSALDNDATGAIEHMQRNGFDACFVGGCVRDLLLGHRPKDFDIVTSATPTQIKRLFRNCRLIGRRFRLAHLYYGSKIIEAATFRGASASDGRTRIEDEGSVERTNTFGTPEEDAFSRDFTVNALLYDPVRREVIDFVGGTADLRARRLRTIGDPMRRFEEDPVRILRAVKFAARLGFALAPDVRDAMRAHAPLISTCPPPRVTEELFRLLESRHFEHALRIMGETGVLGAVLPEVAAALQDEGQRARYKRLAHVLDRAGRAYGGLPREILYPALVYPLLLDGAGRDTLPAGSWGDITLDMTQPMTERMHMPIRLREGMRTTLNLMGFMLTQEIPPTKRRIRSMVGNPVLPGALSLLRIHHQVVGGAQRAYDYWHGELWRPAVRPQAASAALPAGEPGAAPSPPKRKRRRRRKPAAD